MVLELVLEREIDCQPLKRKTRFGFHFYVIWNFEGERLLIIMSPLKMTAVNNTGNKNDRMFFHASFKNLFFKENICCHF